MHQVNNASIIYIAILTVIITICIVDVCYAENPDQEYFIISTGVLGGNYNDAGIALAGLLNKIDAKRFKFKVIASNGSIENIKRLKNRFSDFAIVQRDIFVKNYYGAGGSIKNISVISPLFQEMFLIYTHEKSHINFNKFKNLINLSPRKIKIGIGSVDGATYGTFSEVSSLLGLNKDNIEFVAGNYDELARKYALNEVDYILTFSLPISGIGKARNVYFGDEDIRLLTNRMRHLTTAYIDNKRHKTLGVWALFVGLNGSIDQIGGDAIIKNILSSAKTPIEQEINNAINEFKSNRTLFGQYFKELPVIPSFQAEINHDTSRYGIYVTITLIIIVIIATQYLSRRYSSQKHRKYIWIRYKHIFIGLLLVSIVYLIFIEWMMYGEMIFFRENGIKSSLLDMTYLDLHVWNLVRILGNNDGGVFPVSITGKLAATLSTYAIWIGSISIAVVEFITHRLIAKRREGLMSIKFTGHIIIAGWNDNTSRLIEELLYACTEYYRKKLIIVCVVPDPKTILEKNEYISDLESRRELVLIKGYIRNNKILKQCNAYFAKIIILLAEEAGVHADEKTLMRALSIRKYCHENKQNNPHALGLSDKSTANGFELYKTDDNANKVYILAEVNTEEFVTDLLDAGVNGVVNTNKIVDGVLVQSILNPGVSKLINNVLTFSEDTNEFYTVDLLNPNNSHLRNRTFDELLLPLRKQNILLLAVKVVYRNQEEKEIVDENKIAELLATEGLRRQIITNPITDIEVSRKTDYDDHLIVLAVSADKLMAGLKLVKFDPV